MKYVLLAGGLGTRLRPYTFNIPKPLMPLGQTTLLEHIVNHIKQYNPSEVVLSLGYQAELIKAYCAQKKYFGLKITFIEEDKPLGTAGALHLIQDRLSEDQCFFLMNGDIITELNFNNLYKYHVDNNGTITVATVNHEYQSPFGVLKLHANELVSIEEKPIIRQPVSSGIYCINSNILDQIPKDTFYTMPDLMMAQIKVGKKVFSYEIKEYWNALETKDHFENVLSEGVVK